MDIFLQEPDEIRLPPEEVRLLEVQVTPEPKGRRVKVFMELTPFRKRPNLEVTVTDASGRVAAQVSILETMLRKLEFNLHLREPEPGAEYTIESSVYYQKLPEPSDTPADVPLPEPMVVDHHKATFVLPT
ncbi:MAG: hypothetical protein A2136_08450 [Chloroflexi bacterium RBG_16_54_11]|nr:MAG: hypothetical protein A2136_08450 [Chloroflexi bacterium RBG_16_54_11]